MQSFKTRLKNRGYPNKFSEKFLSEVNFTDRKRSLENKDNGTQKKILPFVTHYHPALPSLKNMFMGKWHLIQTQPHLSEVFKEPPILSYRKGKSLKDTKSELNFEGTDFRIACERRSRAGPSTLIQHSPD